MKRREVYSLVAEFAELAGSRKALVAAAIGAMRMIRGLGHSPGDLAAKMLDSPLRTILLRDDALGEIYQALNAPALEAAYRATARATQILRCRDSVGYATVHAAVCR